jgi:Inner membrane protein YgaP-like, transmembrane domain
MTRNMGILDRRLRGIAAPVALVAALLLGAGSIAGIVLLLVAAIAALTAATGFCPLYALLQLDTRGRRTLPH